jgi:hypothetical protein
MGAFPAAFKSPKAAEVVLTAGLKNYGATTVKVQELNE